VYPVPVPPVAANVTELYGAPEVPVSNDVGLTMLNVTVGGLMVSVNVEVAELFPESVTLNVIEYDPVAFGVPLKTPPALKLIPVGNGGVSDHV
jgi:hypothetical protein